jgi:Copper transport outer membrane protein, MctB
MINFRFHIVSLTAVLLALGIGLVLGTTFLDDALEEALKGQLEGLEASLDRARARNDDLQAQLDAFEEEAAVLGPEIGERLYRGELSGDPVLVVSTRGVEQEWVDNVMQSLSQADANLLGVWWLTDRLALDDDSEVEDLAEALETSTDDADRLERRLVVDLADAMFGASDVPAQPPGASAESPAAAPAEPAVLSRLHEAGFVDYEMPEGVDGDVVLLPTSGLRIVVVDGPGAAIPASRVLQPVLADVTDSGPAAVVAVQPEVRPEDQAEDAPPLLVSLVRDDDQLKERLSTVDNLNRVSGRVAMVLATVDAAPGGPVIGHYGTQDGASDQLPPAAGDG